MTWNPQLRLTPSPIPSYGPPGVEEQAYYATPPLSPSSFGVLGAHGGMLKNSMPMQKVGSQHFDTRACEPFCAYRAYQPVPQYIQASDPIHLSVASSQPTGLGQGAFSFGQERQSKQMQYSSVPQMQDSSMEYDAEYSPNNQRHSQYPAYSSDQTYNNTVPVQLGYGDVRQYQSAHGVIPMGALDNQFGVPQQYYNAAAGPSSTTSQMLPAYSTVQYQPQNQSLYQHTTTGPGPANLPGRGALYSSVGTSKDRSLLNTFSMSDQTVYQTDGNFQTFTNNLQSTYRFIQAGNLAVAGQDLLSFTSDWFVKHLEQFGLTQDNPAKSAERLQLWKDLNHCWLALLQAQKDMTSTQSRNNQTTVMDAGFLKKLGNELVKMCDTLAGKGLVDYEMGIWEEEIMCVLLDCREILVGNSTAGSSSSSAGGGTKSKSKSRHGR